MKINQDRYTLIPIGTLSCKLSLDSLNEFSFNIKISRIDGCNVKRINDLEFDFVFGACNTYKFDKEKILFCFSHSLDPKTNQECHT